MINRSDPREKLDSERISVGDLIMSILNDLKKQRRLMIGCPNCGEGHARKE